MMSLVADARSSTVRALGGGDAEVGPGVRATSEDLQQRHCRWSGVGNDHENRTDPGGRRANR